MTISMMIMRFIMSVSSTLRKQVGRNSIGVGATGFHGNSIKNPPAPRQSQAYGSLRPISVWKVAFIKADRFDQPNSLAAAPVTQISPAEDDTDLAMIPAGGVSCGHPLQTSPVKRQRPPLHSIKDRLPISDLQQPAAYS
jgi:hypothetical protein